VTGFGIADTGRSQRVTGPSIEVCGPRFVVRACSPGVTELGSRVEPVGPIVRASSLVVLALRTGRS
jgi:hypothetical protein